MKTIKSIKNGTYRQLKELLDELPDEALDTKVDVGCTWEDAYGDVCEEWRDIVIMKLCETEDGKRKCFLRTFYREEEL